VPQFANLVYIKTNMILTSTIIRSCFLYASSI